MTKTTQTTKKSVSTLQNTTDDISAEVIDRQTSRDMFTAAFIVSVTINVFVLAVWAVLNVAGSEAATLSVVLGH